jgi:transglutaminase-like putative cysteine protease
VHDVMQRGPATGSLDPAISLRLQLPLFLMIAPATLALARAWALPATILVPLGCGASLLALAVHAVRGRTLAAAVVGAIFAGIAALVVAGVTTVGVAPSQWLAVMRADLLRSVAELLASGRSPGVISSLIGGTALVVATAYSASLSVSRRGATRDPVLLLGSLLAIGVLETSGDPLLTTVLFAVGALLLCVQLAGYWRAELWARRSLTQETGIGPAIQRQGWVAATAVVALAWIMASIAVAAPLDSVLDRAQRLGRSIVDSMQTGGIPFMGGGTSFGAAFTTSGHWRASADPVLEISGTPSAGGYLRMSTHDRYTGHGWDQALSDGRPVPAGVPLRTPGSPDWIDTQGDIPFTVQVTAAQEMNRLATLGTPGGVPESASILATVRDASGSGFLSAIEADLAEGDVYTMTSLVNAPTPGELAAAGEDYPDAVGVQDLDLTNVSAATRELAQELASGAGDNYARARAMVAYLRSSPFRWAADAGLPNNPDQDLVDFFLFDPQGQTGYCEYFASAMVVMARSVGIPARLARGYHVDRHLATIPTVIIQERDAHAWAELYFPGYGWQPFEATPTIADPQSPGAPSRVLDDEPSVAPSRAPASATPPSAAPPPAWQVPALLGVLLLGLAVLVVASVLVRRRQSLRARALPPEFWWDRLLEGGRRAGVVRGRSQTAFEFAEQLGRRLPGHAAEIDRIARAYVERRYAADRPSDAVAGQLADVWARLSPVLAWLAIKRRLGMFRPRT